MLRLTDYFIARIKEEELWILNSPSLFHHMLNLTVAKGISQFDSETILMMKNMINIQ